MLTHKFHLVGAGMAMGLALGIALLIGTVLGLQLGSRHTTLEIPVAGVATDRSESMAIATGLIDGQHVKVLRQYADIAPEVRPARRAGAAAVQQHERQPAADRPPAD
jgi:hypothetical protein